MALLRGRESQRLLGNRHKVALAIAHAAARASVMGLPDDDGRRGCYPRSGAGARGEGSGVFGVAKGRVRVAVEDQGEDGAEGGETSCAGVRLFSCFDSLCGSVGFRGG